MAGFYDGKEYTFCDSIDSLLESLLHHRNRDRIIFAHNGGRFDFLFLFDRLNEMQKKVEMISNGPSIIALKIHCGARHYITLQDSFALLPRSLADLSESYRPEHRKLSGAIDFESGERVDKRNSLHREYLRADCYSLWEILKRYTEMPYVRDIGFRLTRSSTALAAWRSTLKKPIRVTPDHVQAFSRRAYAGGRCEIFRQVMNGGHAFDANSLYPRQMLERLPTEHLGDSSDPLEFGFHEVTVRVPECYMPVLWVRTPKLVFPTGVFRGTYFSEEIKLAVSQGVQILKYHGGHAFRGSTDLFTEYIQTLYKIRQENPGGNAINEVCKDLMNHCYGKFAEREEKKSLIKVNQFDPSSWPPEFSEFHSEKLFLKTGLITVLKYRRSPHMLAHIAAAVTAYGRIHMARTAYLPFQKEIHYTDTDSAYIHKEMPTGPNLGEFKKEYSVKSGFFLLPKGYYLETTDGKIIRKLKGFSKKAMKSITLELFKKGNISVTENKLATFRTALIRENRYLSTFDYTKSVKAGYDKRKLLAGGETRPWEFKNGELR